jgi:methylmalonyl-CoA/ethylmalonyl-CoA epimerase
MRKIEHLGIAVKDIEASNLIFEKLLGVASYKQEIVESEGVKMDQTKLNFLKP